MDRTDSTSDQPLTVHAAVSGSEKPAVVVTAAEYIVGWEQGVPESAVDGYDGEHDASGDDIL